MKIGFTALHRRARVLTKIHSQKKALHPHALGSLTAYRVPPPELLLATTANSDLWVQLIYVAMDKLAPHVN
jgi:hypothetical protein